MMNLSEEIEYLSALPLPWGELEQKTVLVTGASGMIGMLLIDTLMERKENIKIIALGRNEKRAKEVFEKYWDSEGFRFIAQDINRPLPELGEIDYMIHAASNTHPRAYSADPIGTVTTNVLGIMNLMEYAAVHTVKRVLFVSSVEIYGENRGDTEEFAEDYCGYIDCNTLRAGYPESKRVGEALCQAYHAKYGIDFVSVRLSRVYGPTMLKEDSKALAQFIKKGVQGEDIILKSKGTQLFSYVYVADAVSGLLTALLKGGCGEAYNVADSVSKYTLGELAEQIAEQAGSRVVFEIPEESEARGYSKATKALLNTEKMQRLGWRPHWNIKEGVSRTIAVLRQTMGTE